MKSPGPVRAIILSESALMRSLLSVWLCDRCKAKIVAQFDSVQSLLAESSLYAGIANMLVTEASVDQVFAGIKALSGIGKTIKVLVISASQSDYVYFHASRAGATGFIHKNDPGEVFTAAVGAISAGAFFESAAILRSRTKDSVMRKLTNKERLVLEYVCTGGSDEEIAKELGITLLTAQKHRRNLSGKLDAANPAEVVIRGMQMGVIAPEKVRLDGVSRRLTQREFEL
jgi:DNA-binding NarL/FixJ family response regulator